VSWIYKVVSAETKELIGDFEGAAADLEAKWRHLDDESDYDPDVRAMGAAYRLALIRCDQGHWDAAEACLAYGAQVPDRGSFRANRVARSMASARLAVHRGRARQGARALRAEGERRLCRPVARARTERVKPLAVAALGSSSPPPRAARAAPTAAC
jgi:hypothetical protein